MVSSFFRRCLQIGIAIGAAGAAFSTSTLLVSADTLSLRFDDKGNMYSPLAGHEVMIDRDGNLAAVCGEPRQIVPTAKYPVAIDGRKAPLFVQSGALKKSEVQAKCDAVYAFELSQKHSVGLLTDEGKLAADQKLKLVNAKGKEEGALEIAADGAAKFTDKKGRALVVSAP